MSVNGLSDNEMGSEKGRGCAEDAARADAEVVSSLWRWWWVSLWPWAAGAAVAAVLGGLAWAFAPGVPEARRPQGIYRQWRFERLFEAGMEAERRGEMEVAQVAYLAALEGRPSADAPKIRLARMLAARGRFEEAAAQARMAGLDGAGFVHDFLLLEGRFDELLRQSSRLLAAEKGREGVWLYSIRLAATMVDPEARAAIRAEVYPNTDTNPARGLVDAVLAAADGRKEDLRSALARREEAGSLAAAEVLVGLDAWLDAGDPGQALVWVNRHRDRLGAFEQRLADYEIEQARGGVLAADLLESFRDFPLNPSRWSRVAAVAVRGGFSESQFERLEELALRGELAGSRSVSVALWCMSVAGGWSTKEAAWSSRHRAAGGSPPPLLLARGLRDPDRGNRVRATLLLSKETPFPRELLQVAFERPWRA